MRTRTPSSAWPSGWRRRWPTSGSPRRSRGGHVPAGAGSGVVLTPDGFLLTSAHVVAGRSPRRGRATFVDGRDFGFEIVGADPLSDLAVLRSEAAELEPATLGDAEALRVGPAGGRDRQPQRVRRLGDRRRGLRARPLAARSRGAGGARDRQRDPDRRRAESGQLGRRARRQRRPRGRGQHGRGRRRPRPGRADQRRHAPRDRAADDRRARAPRLPRDRRRPAAAAAGRGGGASERARASRWSRSCRTAPRSGRACVPRT